MNGHRTLMMIDHDRVRICPGLQQGLLGSVDSDDSTFTRFCTTIWQKVSYIVQPWSPREFGKRCKNRTSQLWVVTQLSHVVMNLVVLVLCSQSSPEFRVTYPIGLSRITLYSKPTMCPSWYICVVSTHIVPTLCERARLFQCKTSISRGALLRWHLIWHHVSKVEEPPFPVGVCKQSHHHG